MGWNTVAKQKIQPVRNWFELRTVGGALVAKGDMDFVTSKFKELNGVLGDSHFFMPASWSVEKILADIARGGVTGAE